MVGEPAQAEPSARSSPAANRSLTGLTKEAALSNVQSAPFTPSPFSLQDSPSQSPTAPQAKVTLPDRPFAPALPAIQPQYRTEEELIQRLSGGGAVSPIRTSTAPTPTFRPPNSEIQPGGVALPPIPAPITTQRSPSLPSPAIQVTAGSNSDLNLGLYDRAESGADSRAPEFNRTSQSSEMPGSVEASPSPNQGSPSLSSPSLSAPATSAPGAPLPPLPTPASQPSQQLRPLPAPGTAPAQRGVTRSAALNPPSLKFQAVDIYQGDENSARARVTGVYPLSPNVLVGATIDFTDGNAFTDTPEQGISINELYLAASFPSVPNLRVALGQLDLTSYFDRNSFAKDAATHFFNSVFQTNPALAATGIGSRQAALVNWSVTDNVEAKAAVFSSARSISNFELSGFAGEIGLRYGNFIVRGTYASDRDAGVGDSFQEIYQIDRGNGRTGPRPGDREDSYGINAEIFIPSIKMGIFGRYGHYYNDGVDEGADTYSGGISFLDLFMQNDRIGIGYGRQLSNEKLRKRSGDDNPDVFEVFYDFALLPNLRLGFSYQAFEGFSESIFGVRVKTEFDMVPPRR